MNLERLREGRRRWCGEVARLKAASRLLDIDGVLARLPRDLPRSQPALSLHVAKGALVPAPNDLGLLLFSETAVADYIAWLRTHPDGRLRRFNPDTEAKARWRAGVWTKNRHGEEWSEREYGRLAPVLAAADGKQVGPPSLARKEPELANRIRELDARGLKQREIVRVVNAEIAGGRLAPRTAKHQVKDSITRDHVRGVLRRCKVGDYPPRRPERMGDYPFSGIGPGRSLAAWRASARPGVRHRSVIRGA